MNPGTGGRRALALRAGRSWIRWTVGAAAAQSRARFGAQETHSKIIAVHLEVGIGISPREGVFGSVCGSFTAVHGGSPATAGRLSALVTNADGRC